MLVTNDDGIDSVGLHLLALRMQEVGDVVVVAPDEDYSGSSSSIGALHLQRPTVHRAHLEGVTEAWSMTGPPALCVLVACLGPFGPFDLVVSGINPGANVGRSVYHSGTIGACLTARSRGTTGVAISQRVDNWGVEGQGWDDVIASQEWDAAAEVAGTVVEAIVSSPPADPQVLNVNVPNTPVSEMVGWRHTELAPAPPRALATARLDPKPGHENAFTVGFEWGTPREAPPETDVAAVANGEVSLTWLNSFAPTETPPGSLVAKALDDLVGSG